jgi:hypothetical protein
MEKITSLLEDAMAYYSKNISRMETYTSGTGRRKWIIKSSILDPKSIWMAIRAGILYSEFESILRGRVVLEGFEMYEYLDSIGFKLDKRTINNHNNSLKLEENCENL